MSERRLKEEIQIWLFIFKDKNEIDFLGAQ